MTPLFHRTSQAQVEHDQAVEKGTEPPCRALALTGLRVGAVVLLEVPDRHWAPVPVLGRIKGRRHDPRWFPQVPAAWGDWLCQYACETFAGARWCHTAELRVLP